MYKVNSVLFFEMGALRSAILLTCILRRKVGKSPTHVDERMAYIEQMAAIYGSFILVQRNGPGRREHFLLSIDHME